MHDHAVTSQNSKLWRVTARDHHHIPHQYEALWGMRVCSIVQSKRLYSVRHSSIPSLSDVVPLPCGKLFHGRTAIPVVDSLQHAVVPCGTPISGPAVDGHGRLSKKS